MCHSFSSVLRFYTLHRGHGGAFFLPGRFHIRVNNVRHVAVMFDALLENRLIEPYWQSVLDKGRFLVSKDGKSYVSASSLSTALSIARIKKTAVANGIRKAIAGLKE